MTTYKIIGRKAGMTFDIGLVRYPYTLDEEDVQMECEYIKSKHNGVDEIVLERVVK